jgi:hypothetical protein
MLEESDELEVLVSPPKQGQHEEDLPVNLAQPARRALNAAGIQSLKQLTNFSETEIKRLHGIGPNALSQLRRALAENGMSFADKK